MGGEPQITIEQPLAELDQADPIVVFLEKHGSSLVTNHEGQMVTVSEAMANCPPFARLVESMGEAALSFVAPRKAEQEQETEEEVETEDAESQEPEVKEDSRPETKIEETKKIEQIEPKPAREQPAAETKQQAPLKVEASQSIAKESTEPITNAATETAAPINKSNVEPAVNKVEAAGNSGAISVEAKSPVSVESDSSASEQVKSEVKIKTIAEPAPATGLRAPEISFAAALSQGQNPEPEEGIPYGEVEAADELVDLEAPDIEFKLPAESFIYEPAEPEKPLLNLPAEFSLPIEKIEETITQMSEKLEELETDEAQAVYETLDQIAELSSMLVASPEEGAIEAVEVRQELEELFTDLLEQVEIEYTPELIEALVDLSVQRRLAEEAVIEEKKLTEDTPKDRGTHEAIKQILVGVSNIKKTILYAYILGKSAIRLYAYDAI